MPHPSLIMFVKLPGKAIEAVIPADVQDAIRRWKKQLQAHPRSSGMLFAGYAQPPSQDFDEVLEVCEGVMLISESARWLLPESLTAASTPNADIPGSTHYPKMMLYQAGAAWASLPRDVSIPTNMVLGTRQWQRLGTTSQEKYLARIPTIDTKDPTQVAQIAPAWALDVPIEHVSLSGACLRGLKAMNVTTIADLQHLSVDRLVRSFSLGKQKGAEVAEALTTFLALGPDDYYLLDQRGQMMPLLDCILEPLKTLPEPGRSILRARLALDGTQGSSKDLAQQFGLTSGSIRQVERNALLSVPRAQRIGQLMRHRLGALLQDRLEPLFLDALTTEDPWFRGLSERPVTTQVLLHHFAPQEFFLWQHGDRFVVARISFPEFVKLKAALANPEKVKGTISTFTEEEEASDALIPKNALDLFPLLGQTPTSSQPQ